MASKPRPSTATSRNGPTKSPKAPGTEKDKEQSARFMETARELGVDETGKAFEQAIKKIVAR